MLEYNFDIVHIYVCKKYLYWWLALDKITLFNIHVAQYCPQISPCMFVKVFAMEAGIGQCQGRASSKVQSR